jgi:CheY-like chemotaxis protein
MSKKQLKVLLVEHQPNVVEVIKQTLDESGHSVSVSVNTDTALLRTRAFQFDYFIVNCGDDGLQGLNFANAILKDGIFENTPFLFLVNPNQKVDIRLRKFNHSFDLLRLPIDKTELLIRFNRLKNPVEKLVVKNISKVSDSIKPKADLSTKVLLVEDNPLNQKVLGMFISKLGLSFDVASNGQMSVDLSLKENYPFILMDIYMPGMDGTEATELIRKNEEGSSHRAKIIAITANESEDSVKRCYDSGMDDFLVKPFSLEALKEKLV